MQQEKEFFERLGRRDVKKISLNISARTLKQLDELTKITKTSRTLLIESIMLTGLKEYLKVIEGASIKVKKQHKDRKDFVRKVDEMSSKLKSFRKKWKI